MAKLKVSILYPERQFVPELGEYTPIYNREIEDTLLVPYLRMGVVAVDAENVEVPIVYDATTNAAKKGVIPKQGPQIPSPGGSGVGVPGA